MWSPHGGSKRNATSESFNLIRISSEWVITLWQCQQRVSDEKFNRGLVFNKKKQGFLNGIPPGWRLVTIYLSDLLLSQRCFDISATTEGENKLSTPLPLLNIEQTPTGTGLQEPQAAVRIGILWLYWPERADGRLQCGWGQTYSHRLDPHWYRWLPVGTASPPFCHCRVWEKAQWVSRRNPRRSQTRREAKEGTVAVKMCR